MKMKFKVAMSQFLVSPSKEENLKKAAAQIDEAAAKGAELICFPEVGFTRFFPAYNHDATKFDDAEPIPGPISDFLCKKAKEKNIVIVASYLEEGYIGEYYDSAICVDADGTLLGVTRMIHTFEQDGYNEKFYYGTGHTSYPVYETSVGAVGISICYDAWIPEAMRALALKGADLIVVPTCEVVAVGLPPTDHVGGTSYEAVCTMQKANAICNGVWVGVSNRVGHEGVEGIEYVGSSFVVDPWGHIKAMANDKHDEVLVCEVDLNISRKVRQIWPMLRDRVPETYGSLLKSYGSTPYYHPQKVKL